MMGKFGAALRTNSAVVVGETIAIAVLQFVAYAVLLRMMDRETVGLWLLINALISFSKVADFWSTGLSSFVAQARGQGLMERASSYAATATAAAAAGYLILAALGWAVLDLSASWLVDPEHVETVRGILPLMALTFWLLSTGGTLSLAFLGFERPRLKASLTVGGSLLFLLLVLILAPEYGIWGVLAAQALQALTILTLGLALGYAVILRPHGGAPRRALFAEMSGYGLKALGIGLFQLAIEPATRLLINAFGGLAAVAMFELASRLIATMRNLLASLGQILIPAFARLGIVACDVGNMLRWTERQFLIFGVAGFSALLASGPLVANMILGAPSSDFLIMLWILTAGWFANLLSVPAYFLLMGRRRLRPLFITHVIMAGGALALGSGLGVAFGLTGALVGIAMALAASAFQLWHAAHDERETGVDGDKPRMFVLFLPPLTAALSLIVGPTFLHEPGPLRLGLDLLPILVTGAVILAFLPLRTLFISFNLKSFEVPR